MSDNEPTNLELLTLTSQIVSSHVSRNSVAPGNLPEFIRSVHEALVQSGQPIPEEPEQKPAVPIKKSVQGDYIVCLEDGKKLKMLKRHLKTAYGMTPEEYRQKWNLSPDYPMVAPSYAAKRSELAKNIGLGRIRRGKEEVAQETKKKTAKKGRKAAEKK
ncbi:MucR family transcriptional regulator [Fodinicurvata fenggangensis]|uniref:MucR family transcriptional regulator n=1 Tax=Fodinicurvata fenggangensis TaxID=1121830 RepID=UPI00047E0A0B|nr:MucR family transcriptional regulator [Fodinicurvata fenggangensis]